MEKSDEFTEADGRTLMPLSITCHHATTDGRIYLRRVARSQPENRNRGSADAPAE